MGKNNPITHFGKPLITIALGIAGFLGLILALGGESLRSTYWQWAAILYVHWTAIIYLIWLAVEFRRESFSSPPVKSVRINEGLLVVGHRDWLGMSVAVLVFKQEGDFERVLCAGRVINVQQNRLVQILLITTGMADSEIETIKAKLSDGENSSLIIKPGQAQEIYGGR